MSLEIYIEILSQFPKLSRLDLQGMGEPLMNKDFTTMVDWATKRGIWVQFFTNGVLLTPELSDYLMEARIYEITISLDGVRPETYELIRPGATFEGVRNNAESLAVARRRAAQLNQFKRLPRLRLAMVMTRYNVNELPDLVRLGHSLGFDQVVATQFKPISTEMLSWVPDVMDVHNAVHEAEIVAHNLQQDLTIEFALPPVGDIPMPASPKKTRPVKYKPCNWPWSSLNITINGAISPCAYMPQAEKWGLGNLLQDPFSALWNAAPYRHLRQCHRSGTLNGLLCADCRDV